DPAGGERGAEGGDRALADQVGGAVDQVAALVEQHIDLLAAGAGGFFKRGKAGQGAVGQVGLEVGFAQAGLFAGGSRGTADGVGGIRGRLLQVATGLGQVGFQV